MQNLAPSRHAILGASSAYRWLACTPSARFEEQIIGEESYFAAEGTLAHDLAALILSSRAGIFKGDQTTFNMYLDQQQASIIEFYVYHDNPDPYAEFNAMLDYAEAYAAFVRSLGGDIYIEREVDFSQFVPLGFGTCDARNELPKILYITDYKYGAGKKVAARNNPQLRLYAIGGLLDILKANPTYKPEKIVMSIYQPRVAGVLDPVSTDEITPEELLAWAEFEVSPKAQIAIGGQGEFVTGDHCGFCKARTVCKAYFDKFSELLAIQDKRVMSADDVAKVLTYGGTIKTWAESVRKDAIAKLETGKPVKGFKLVAGSSVRKFKSEDAVVDMLIGEGWDTDDIYKMDMHPLTTIEKKLKAKRFTELLGELIINVPYGNTIAPEDDSREAVNLLGADEFEDDEDLT